MKKIIINLFGFFLFSQLNVSASFSPATKSAAVPSAQQNIPWNRIAPLAVPLAGIGIAAYDHYFTTPIRHNITTLTALKARFEKRPNEDLKHSAEKLDSEQADDYRRMVRSLYEHNDLLTNPQGMAYGKAGDTLRSVLTANITSIENGATDASTARKNIADLCKVNIEILKDQKAARQKSLIQWTLGIAAVGGTALYTGLKYFWPKK